MYSIIIFLWLLYQLSLLSYRFIQATKTYYFSSKPIQPAAQKCVLCQPKPQWVVDEVIRLSAFMPKASCRQIAATFNTLHKTSRKMTVSKSYVYYKRREYAYTILLKRKDIKRLKPRPLPKNATWGMDLTFVTDNNQHQYILLGIVDHGTRACIALRCIKDKSTITLLRCLLDSIEKYGKPRAIRTDNESCFTSKLLSFVLILLNIRQQRTQACCPWQNGRVERFFGTFKSKAKALVIQSAGQLSDDLANFRLWYNHVRLHENLRYRTPANVWHKTEPNCRGQAYYFSAWAEKLTGFYVPPD